MGMETRFHWLCFFQVILAYESIVLCKCSGKYIDIYFNLKITFHTFNNQFIQFVPFYALSCFSTSIVTSSTFPHLVINLFTTSFATIPNLRC